MAIEKTSGQMIFNPVASYVIEKGDKLVALGEDPNLIKFSEVCNVEATEG